MKDFYVGTRYKFQFLKNKFIVTFSLFLMSLVFYLIIIALILFEIIFRILEKKYFLNIFLKLLI